MNRPIIAISSLILVGAASVSCGAASTAADDETTPRPTAEGSLVFPVISDVGGAASLPDAAFQPSESGPYKVVFDITSGAESAGQINPGLEKVARFLNIYASAGVEPGEMQLVAVLHGDATVASLSDAAHRQHTGVANPNAGLLEQLSQNGVRLTVCGQALAHNDFATTSVHRTTEVALAALTVTPILALDGYTVQPL